MVEVRIEAERAEKLKLYPAFLFKETETRIFRRNEVDKGVAMDEDRNNNGVPRDEDRNNNGAARDEDRNNNRVTMAQ